MNLPLHLVPDDLRTTPTSIPPCWGTAHPITSMKSPAQAQLRLSHLMDPFAGIGSDWGQGGRSSPTKVKEQERMEDGVDVRNNNHDNSVY